MRESSCSSRQIVFSLALPTNESEFRRSEHPAEPISRRDHLGVSVEDPWSNGYRSLR